MLVLTWSTGRIPFDQYHLEVALGHYQDLALTSGMSLPDFVNVISRERGFLGDHECVESSRRLFRPLTTSARYPFLEHIIANM